MRTAQLLLSHYLTLIVFTGIGFILGRRLLRQVVFHSGWETAAFSITLGLGSIAYIVFFVGMLSLLYAWIIALILAILLGAAIFTTPAYFSTLRTNLTTWRIKSAQFLSQKASLVFLGCLVLIVGSGSLLPLYPPYTWDATEYHLSVAKLFASNHAVIVTEFLRYPVYTQLNHMLFTFMLLFSDDLSAQLVQYLFYTLIGILIFAYCYRHFSARAGILAAVLWLSNPIAVDISTIGYIDIGLILLGTAGLFAFLHYTQTRQTAWLILSGVLLGFAAAVKYPALFWIGISGLYSIWIAYKERKWYIPVLFGLVIAAVACPFYLRNIYYTGNPFFPYISFLSKENIWTNADFANLASEQTTYGIAKTWLNFIALPWHLAVSPKLFQSPFYPYNWFFLAFFPVTIIYAVLKPHLRSILLFAAAFTVFWFLTPQILRYLLPVFPLYFLLTGAAFDSLLNMLLPRVEKKLNPRIFRQLMPFLYFLVLGSAVLKAGYANIYNITHLGPLPTTAAERDQFLTSKLISYPAYQYLNKTRGQDYRLYALFDENMSYFADGVFMGDWFGPGRFEQVFSVLPDGQKLYETLTKLDANYFLYQDSRIKLFKLPDDTFFHDHFKKLYDKNGVLLFELTPAQ